MDNVVLDVRNPVMELLRTLDPVGISTNKRFKRRIILYHSKVSSISTLGLWHNLNAITGP